MSLKKTLMLLIVGASTLHGCGGEQTASEISATTDSVSTTEVYRGTDDGTLCELTIVKDEKNQVIEMQYRSPECKGNEGKPCDVDFKKKVFSSFKATPSVQLPGYTRIALNNLILPYPILGLMALDEFVAVKDNFTNIKAVGRRFYTYGLKPVGSENWTSECRDVKQVQ